MFQLRTLGTLDLRSIDGHPVHSLLAQPKRMAILCYLAVARPHGFHRRDRIAALFWPEHDTEHARHSLRQALHAMRSSLGEGALVTRGEEVAISPACVWCDATELDRAHAERRWADALELHRGELLDGFYLDDCASFEQWVEEERERLHGQAEAAAWHCAELRVADGDAGGALACAERALELARHDEQPLRRFMQLATSLGDRPAALRAYERFVSRLQRDYELEPSAETAALAEQLRKAGSPAAIVPAAGTVRPRGEAASAAAEPVPAQAAPSHRFGPGRKAVLVLTPLLLALAATASWIGYSGGFADLPTALRVRLGTVQSERLGFTQTASLRAQELYLRGKFKLNEWNHAGLDSAILALEAAVAEDSGFAAARAALANAYNEKADLFEPLRRDLREKAFINAETAVLLDPQLADGYIARGNVIWTKENDFPHAAALRAFRRAAELQPDMSVVHDRLALVYLHVGLVDRALQEARIGVALDPLDHGSRFRVGLALAILQRHREAAAVLQALPQQVAPILRAPLLAESMLHLGQAREALALVDPLVADYPRDPWLRAARALLHAHFGDSTRARTDLHEAAAHLHLKSHAHHAEFTMGLAYTLIGEPDSAVYWLRTAARSGYPCYSQFAGDTLLNPLRPNSEFRALLEEIKEVSDGYRREFLNPERSFPWRP